MNYEVTVSHLCRVNSHGESWDAWLLQEGMTKRYTCRRAALSVARRIARKAHRLNDTVSVHVAAYTPSNVWSEAVYDGGYTEYGFVDVVRG